MSHALTNRCGVYRVTHAFEPWQEWAADAGVNPLVVGFLSKNQEFLLMDPPEGDDTAYCHPSPRAWTLAARDLDCDESKDTDFQTILVSGRVGQGAAVKFKVWLDHYRHIEPIVDALVRKGTKPGDNMGIERQLVCALSAVGRVASKCRNEPSDKTKKASYAKEVIETTTNVMGWVKDLPPEFCIAAVKSTLTMEMIQKHQLTKIKPFMEAFLKVRKSMKDQ